MMLLPGTLAIFCARIVGFQNVRKGLTICCPQLMHANGNTILTTDCKVLPIHFASTNGFFATKSFQRRLVNFFDVLIASVACFAARHRKISTNDRRKLDAHCRKLFRRSVGLPPDMAWNQPWHTIVLAWHNRIDQQFEYHGFKIWSAQIYFVPPDPFHRKLFGSRNCCIGQSPRGGAMVHIFIPIAQICIQALKFAT